MLKVEFEGRLVRKLGEVRQRALESTAQNMPKQNQASNSYA